MLSLTNMMRYCYMSSTFHYTWSINFHFSILINNNLYRKPNDFFKSFRVHEVAC
ncbi:hypothetical protein HanPSC8_Chr13g0562791 [Helianthus annuus]|nr:hypothetical protein HanPSC8_Chr13g0562791 [Helianthus annuus]